MSIIGGALLRPGYCAPTADLGDCIRGSIGTLPVTPDRMGSAGSSQLDGPSQMLLQCTRRCLACKRCTYISFASDDCSWFSNCRQLSTQLSQSHQTVRVRAPPFRKCRSTAGLCLTVDMNTSAALDYAIIHHSGGTPRRQRLSEKLLSSARSFSWDDFRSLQNFCQAFARTRMGLHHAFALGSAARWKQKGSAMASTLGPPAAAGAIRTLVVLLSETRSWDLTWDRFEAHLLRPLSAELALCVHVSDNRTHGHAANPFYRRASFIWVFHQPNNFSEAFDQAFDHERRVHAYPHTSWRELLGVKSDHNTGSWLGGVAGATILKEDGLGQIGYSGGELYARWVLVQHLATVLHRYARVVLTRSDTLFCAPHPPVDFDHIWIPRGEEDWFGLTDRHAVFPARVALQGISMLTLLFRDPKGYAAKMKADRRGELSSSFDDVLRGIPRNTSNPGRSRPLLDENGHKADWNFEQVYAFCIEEAGLAGMVRSLQLPVLTIVSHAHEPHNFLKLHMLELPGLAAAVKYPRQPYSWTHSCRAMVISECSGRLDAQGRRARLKMMRAAYYASRWPSLLIAATTPTRSPSPKRQSRNQGSR